MRTGTNDKQLISDHSFRAYNDLEALRTLLKFSISQIERINAEDFASEIAHWRSLLRLMKEKADSAATANEEIAFLADTCIQPEAVH